jgi:hypothetical protein
MSYPPTVRNSHDKSPEGWIAENFLLLASAVVLYVAVFAARFSVSRVFGEISLNWVVLGEIRTWAVLSAAVLVFVGWKSRPVPASRLHLKRVWASIGLIAFVQLALMAHALLYRSGPSPAYFAWELLTIVVIAALLALAFQIWGLRFVTALMWVALGFALLIAAWMLAVALGARKTGADAPLATTFTFYRIQVFGGFAAFTVLFGSRKIVRSVLIGLCAILCLAAAYLSLSKAALLAGSSGALFLAAVYATWFSKARAGIVLGIAIAAVALFSVASGGLFVARVSEGLLGVGYALSTASVPAPTREEAIALDGDDRNYDLYRATFEAQKTEAAVVACTAGKYACPFKVKRWEQDIADTMLRFRVYVPDFSFRLRLLMQGMSGIANAPWMGNGFGTFSAVATNLYTKEPEPYSHPHNIVVELLYSVGILGAMLVGAAIAGLVWLVMQAKEGVQSSLPMLAYVVSVFIGSVFGGDYMDFRLAWFGLVVCIMLGGARSTDLADDRRSV